LPDVGTKVFGLLVITCQEAPNQAGYTWNRGKIDFSLGTASRKLDSIFTDQTLMYPMECIAFITDHVHTTQIMTCRRLVVW
jgi:hypothetical protein